MNGDPYNVGDYLNMRGIIYKENQKKKQSEHVERELEECPFKPQIN